MQLFIFFKDYLGLLVFKITLFGQEQIEPLPRWSYCNERWSFSLLKAAPTLPQAHQRWIYVGLSSPSEGQAV